MKRRRRYRSNPVSTQMLVVGGIVVAGLGIGAYFLLRKKDAAPEAATPTDGAQAAAAMTAATQATTQAVTQGAMQAATQAATQASAPTGIQSAMQAVMDAASQVAPTDISTRVGLRAPGSALPTSSADASSLTIGQQAFRAAVLPQTAPLSKVGQQAFRPSFLRAVSNS